MQPRSTRSTLNWARNTIPAASHRNTTPSQAKACDRSGRSLRTWIGLPSASETMPPMVTTARVMVHSTHGPPARPRQLAAPALDLCHVATISAGWTTRGVAALPVPTRRHITPETCSARRKGVDQSPRAATPCRRAGSLRPDRDPSSSAGLHTSTPVQMEQGVAAISTALSSGQRSGRPLRRRPRPHGHPSGLLPGAARPRTRRGHRPHPRRPPAPLRPPNREAAVADYARQHAQDRHK